MCLCGDEVATSNSPEKISLSLFSWDLPLSSHTHTHENHKDTDKLTTSSMRYRPMSTLVQRQEKQKGAKNNPFMHKGSCVHADVDFTMLERTEMQWF